MAISAESNICAPTIWNDEQLKNMEIRQYVIILDCRVYKRDETVFARLRENTKICYFVFTVIIFLQRCSLSISRYRFFASVIKIII